MNVVADRPRRLESYIAGAWMRGAKDGVTLRDAATGAPVALVDSSGIDFAAALAYGREKGGPALRRMSFHERAMMLKALAQALMERKEEFYALSTATGATRPDSWIDIEGGIGTLFSYASKGRRELPNSHEDAPRNPRPQGAPGQDRLSRHRYRHGLLLPGALCRFLSCLLPAEQRIRETAAAAMSLMARATSATVFSVTTRKSCGSQRWSMMSMERPSSLSQIVW